MSEKEMPKTIAELIATLSQDEFMKLYADSLQLDTTGVLPMNAPLRTVTAVFFKDTALTVLNMMIVSREIYKKMAMDYAKVLKVVKELDIAVTAFGKEHGL